MPGVVSGTLLTFIPASGDYVNAELLGSTDTRMIGNVIQTQFLRDPGLSDGRRALVHPDGRDPRHGHALHPQVRDGGAGLDGLRHDWLKRHLVVIAGLLTLGYLLLPNVVVTVFSFNKPKGRFNYDWQQFSTGRLEATRAASPDMCGSLSLSLQIAVWATLGATSSAR